MLADGQVCAAGPEQHVCSITARRLLLLWLMLLARFCAAVSCMLQPCGGTSLFAFCWRLLVACACTQRNTLLTRARTGGHYHRSMFNHMPSRTGRGLIPDFLLKMNG